MKDTICFGFFNSRFEPICPLNSVCFVQYYLTVCIVSVRSFFKHGHVPVSDKKENFNASVFEIQDKKQHRDIL